MRFAKPHKLKMNTFVVVTAAVLLFTHWGEAGAVSAAPDQYDPRRDPNYSREAFQTAPIHWDAVWGLVWEFEARTYLNVDRPQVAAPYAQPQPWHYVQGTTPSIASPLAPEPSIYGGWYGSPLYAAGLPYVAWWNSSPRIPWWTLIPFKKDHHRPRPHHEGKGRHHR
jgi:hypothetical protein